jgi:hypothetical protein
MKKLSWRPRLSLLAGLIPIGAVMAVAASGIPKAQSPAVITSLGQSPDAYATDVLAKRAGLKLDYNNLLLAEDVSKYKTVLMAVGASLKGLGSAGINLDTELARGKEIVKQAKDNAVFLIIAHIGGEGRREQMSNELLDAVAAQADFLLVTEEGNQDGYFTQVAEKNSIPITIIENALKLEGVLKEIFSEQD